MFDNLTSKLHSVFRDLAGYGKLSEKNMEQALRQIRTSLLEADVNYKVVKRFIDDVRKKAIGKKVFKTVTPTQMLVKIVRDELVTILGEETREISFSEVPTVIMLVGLHGSGKTTTCAKLAKQLKDKGKKPLLVAMDIERPAAVQQLQKLGEQVQLPVFEPGKLKDVVKICNQAIKKARKESYDVLLLDTAGRWHVEEDMISQLVDLKEKFNPQEILLVIDATLGQDSVNVANEFNKRLSLSGLILTKIDGDSRGGAALSAKMVTGCPIRFIGTGEHLKDLEPFYPDRLASRILGLGDIITLVEKLEKVAKEEEKLKGAKKKVKKQELDLADFLKSIKQIKKIGPMREMMKMMPMGGMLGGGLKADKDLSRIEAIICSMTPKERKHPEILDGSRRKRIADGSGTTVHEINLLIQRFEKMKKSMKKMQKQFGSGGLGGPGGLRMPQMGKFPFPPKRF